MKEKRLVRTVAEDHVVEQLADREVFRARVDVLLVDLLIAARRLGAGDPDAAARRALSALVEEAVTGRQ